MRRRYRSSPRRWGVLHRVGGLPPIPWELGPPPITQGGPNGPPQSALMVLQEVSSGDFPTLLGRVDFGPWEGRGGGGVNPSSLGDSSPPPDGTTTAPLCLRNSGRRYGKIEFPRRFRRGWRRWGKTPPSASRSTSGELCPRRWTHLSPEVSFPPSLRLRRRHRNGFHAAQPRFLELATPRSIPGGPDASGPPPGGRHWSPWGGGSRGVPDESQMNCARITTILGSNGGL